MCACARVQYLSTEVSYDYDKNEAAKQAAKKAEVLAIESYKKMHAQKLLQASQSSRLNRIITLNFGKLEMGDGRTPGHSEVRAYA